MSMAMGVAKSSAPVDPTRGQETLDLRRFMELTNEMREQNTVGTIDAE